MPIRRPGAPPPPAGPGPGLGAAAGPGGPGAFGGLPGPPRLARRLQHPAQVILTGFGLAIAIGTALLSLPVATTTGERASFVDALFTATSAVCVTGLAVVDTQLHWSTFGELVILGLFQVGGLGIMTMAALTMLLVSRRLGLRTRLVAQMETKVPGLGGIRRTIRNIVIFSLICETVTAIVLTTRFALTYHLGFGDAVYHGVFHAVSAFNNAGFALYPDGMTRFATDPWILLPLALAVIVGGLGFPVVFELLREWRKPAMWSVQTRITLMVTAILLVGGTIVITAVEGSNPATLGAHDGEAAVLGGFFYSAMTRSGGFNSVDIAAMRPESLFASDILMFIGGGSGSTAGGIKVTTFGLLAFVIWAEMRGEPRVNVGRRRVPSPNQRQALTIALLSISAVAIGTFVMLAATAYPFDAVLFEVISAFGTVGMSTGITPHLPVAMKILLVALMFVGRVGPLTAASALALREKTRRFELPEERTIVG